CCFFRCLDCDEARPNLALHAFDEGSAIFCAAAVHANLLDRGPDDAHRNEMPPSLAAGAEQSEDPAIGARKNIGPDRTRDRRLGPEPILRRLVEQGQGADDDRLELGGFAVVDDVDPPTGAFVLLGSAMKSVTLDVNEHAGDFEPMTAARVNGQAAV